MTIPDTGATTPMSEPKAESFMDWFHVNSKLVTAGAIVVLIAAGGAWYYQSAKTQKLENADKQLQLAKQSLRPGNPNTQLAESDLKRVSERYAGTTAGTEAGMLLATLKLEKGDAPGAIAYLQELTGKLGSSPNAASARSLLGDAYSQAGKAAEAAAEYERAAAASSMPNERAFLMAKAGHSYMAAGKGPEARRVWETLASNQESPGLAAEARVRLGELLARPAKS